MRSLFFILGCFVGPVALASQPVTLSQPTPAIAASYAVGANETVVYTVTNLVPSQSFPISVATLVSPVSRVSVAHDCGNRLATGPSTCQIGITIAPQTADAGQWIHQTLSIDYQGREPLSSPIDFYVNALPLRTTVGQYTDGLLSYTSTNNGATWAISNTLPPLQDSDNNLNGIACSGSGLQCTTVGYYQDTIASKAAPLSFASSDGGVNWTSVTRLPLIANSSNNRLKSIACNSATGLLCTAVGFYLDATIGDYGTNMPLSYSSSDGGINWTRSSAIPLAAVDAATILNSVACDSTSTNCTAVGTYTHDNQTLPASYVSSNSGANWALSSTLPPSQYSIESGDPNYDQTLNSVACSSNGQQCVAVGNYVDLDSQRVPASYTSSNGGVTWALSTTQPQGDLSDDHLFAVACNGTGLACTAVGYNDSNVALAYYSVDGGIHWSNASIDPPPSSNHAHLLGVTCSSSGTLCTATGYYVNADSQTVPLSYTSSNSGANWSLSTTLPAALGSGANALSGVA